MNSDPPAHGDAAGKGTLGSLARGLLEAARHPMLILSAAATIVAANERTAQLLREPVDSLIGRSVTDPTWSLRDGAGRPLIDSDTPRRLFETSRASFSNEFELTRRDGSRVWIEAISVPVFGSANTLSWVVIALLEPTRSEADKATERKRARVDLITRTIHAVSLADDEEALDAILERLCGRLGEYVVVRALVGDHLPIVASRGSTPQLKGMALSSRALPPLYVSEGLSGRVIKEARPLTLRGAAEVEAYLVDSWRPVVTGIGIANFAVLPVRWQGRVIGTLGIGRIDPGDFIEAQELEELEPLTDWIAHTIMARKRADAGNRAQALLDALIAITRTAAGPVDLFLAVDMAVRQLASAVRGAAAVHRLDPAGGRLEIAGAAGFRTPAIRQTGAGGGGRLARIAREGTVGIDDLRTAEGWDRPELVRDEGLVAYQAVAIRSGGAVQGVLELFAREPGEIASGDFLAAVAAVLAGIFAAGRAPREVREPPPATPAIRGGSNLTPTELNILRLLADGLSNAEIAERVHLSRETVKFHLSNLYRRLAVGNRAELVALAIKRGWV